MRIQIGETCNNFSSLAVNKIRSVIVDVTVHRALEHWHVGHHFRGPIVFEIYTCRLWYVAPDVL